MKVTAFVDEDRHVVIPPRISEALNLEPGMAVDVEVTERLQEAARKFDPERFKAALDKYEGSMREQMLADGYASVDELMDDIRPPW